MTREREVADLLLADSQILALLPGGIFTDQEVGVEGLRRGDDSPTASAFDPTGLLLACAIVRQRGELPYQNIRLQRDKIAASSQVVEVYYYEMRGHDTIDPAKQRAFEVLEGVRLPRSYPIIWLGDSPHFPDVGPVMNSTTVRQDWQVISLKRPV